MHHGRTLLTLLALTTATTSCRLLRPDPAMRAGDSVQSAEPAQPVASPRRTGPLGDANIAAMVLALNNTDISYARLVPSRAQRDDAHAHGSRWAELARD
jgi:hypothetical protein